MHPVAQRQSKNFKEPSPCRSSTSDRVSVKALNPSFEGGKDNGYIKEHNEKEGKTQITDLHPRSCRASTNRRSIVVAVGVTAISSQMLKPRRHEFGSRLRMLDHRFPRSRRSSRRGRYSNGRLCIAAAIIVVGFGKDFRSRCKVSETGKE